MPPTSDGCKPFDSDLHAELHDLHEAAEAAGKAAWQARVAGSPDLDDLEGKRLDAIGDVYAKKNQNASSLMVVLRNASEICPCAACAALTEIMRPTLDKIQVDIDAIAEAVVVLRRALT